MASVAMGEDVVAKKGHTVPRAGQSTQQVLNEESKERAERQKQRQCQGSKVSMQFQKKRISRRQRQKQLRVREGTDWNMPVEFGNCKSTFICKEKSEWSGGRRQAHCCQLRSEWEVGSLTEEVEGLAGSWERQRDKGEFLSVCNGCMEHVYKLRSE